MVNLLLYLLCNWHSLNINYYGTIFSGMLGSFNSSKINACVVGIVMRGHRFIVSSERLGLQKNVAPEGIRTQHLLHASTRRTTRLWLSYFLQNIQSTYSLCDRTGSGERPRGCGIGKHCDREELWGRIRSGKTLCNKIRTKPIRKRHTYLLLLFLDVYIFDDLVLGLDL